VLESTEFALISFFDQAAENQGSSYILRGQRKGEKKIVLNRSIAGLFDSCNYIFALTIYVLTFVEGTLLKYSFCGMQFWWRRQHWCAVSLK